MYRDYFSESSEMKVHWHVYQPLVTSVAPVVHSAGITPNAVTLLRVPLVVAVFLLLKNPNEKKIWKYLVASLIVLLCGMMDDLDGYLARRYKMHSDLGKWLDIGVDFFTFAAIMTIICLHLGYKVFIAAVVPIVAGIVLYKRYEAKRSKAGEACDPLLNVVTHIFVCYVLAFVFLFFY